ncbi:uncharacterized protein LOC106641397 [Copidosoma floridanum]|uniref:uncharacterized protein LOC106641397 n=1 Tax=Copidosoma floridanum TaxID=29053 RepID=UPI0006C9DD25|nr:uncharacterized protein LOC106641397 [Copidosoma floridanum]
MAESVPTTTFSFRMFDMYRRFVELLQLNPMFLGEFKTGNPHTDTCKQLIRRTFLQRQSEERTSSLVKYLKENAIVIAQHAEQVPDNWKDAIKYTNDCIRNVKKVLQDKGITIKTFWPDQRSVDSLSGEIAAVLHGERFTDLQLQAIKDYLMFDLKNPKKIILSSTPTTSKFRKKNAAKAVKVESPRLGQDKTPKLKMMIRRVSNQNSPLEGYVTCSGGSAKVHNQQVVRPKRLENKQVEYSMMSCDSVSMKLSQFSGVNSDDEPMYDTANGSSENWMTSLYKTPKNVSNIPDKCIKQISQNSYYDDSMVADLNESSIKVEKDEDCFTNTPVDYTRSSKRKNPFNEHHAFAESRATKFISIDSLPTQNNNCVTTSENHDNDTSQQLQAVMEPIVEITEKNETINVGSISPVININDVSYEEMVPFKRIQADASLEGTEPFKNVEVKLESDIQNTCTKCKTRLHETAESIFKLDRNEKYTSVENMRYSEVQKLVETAIDFCIVKNEASLDEFLVLRRFRDRLRLKSLQENV